MPLQVAAWDTVMEYIEGAPGARIYFRIDGKKMTVVAGMLSWSGTVKDADEFRSMQDFLNEHDAIEVLSYRDVRELFA